MPIESHLLEAGILYQHVTGPFKPSELIQAQLEGNAILQAAGCDKFVLIFDLTDALVPALDLSFAELRRLVAPDRNRIQGIVIIQASRGLKLLTNTLQRILNLSLIHVADKETAIRHAHNLLTRIPD